MRGRRNLCMAAALSAALCVAPQAPAQTAVTPAGVTYLTYTEEAPCPPEAAGRRPRKRVRRHVRHAPRAHRRHVAVQAPVQHAKTPLKVRKRVRRHLAPHLIKASQPVHHKRCSVVRRDRLTSAAFGISPTDAIVEPASYDITPGGPIYSSASSSGREAFGDPVGGGAGGGATGGGVGNGGFGGGGGPSVSAAPEPDGWLLMIVGVALGGVALRRRRLRPIELHG